MRLLETSGYAKAGLPPGTPVFTGERKSSEVKITVIGYDEENVSEKRLSSASECIRYKGSSAVVWINIDGLHEEEVLKTIGEDFGIHLLSIEDILNVEQRPKAEDTGKNIVMVLKMLYSDGAEGDIVAEQVSVILGEGYVLSFQEREGDVFENIRERIRQGRGQVRNNGADYLAYALVDAIIDNYYVVLEQIGERIEVLEDNIIEEACPKHISDLHSTKRDMIYLRRTVWPLRELAGKLERRDSSLIKESTRPYLRDLYEHSIQVIDTVETYRDMLSGLMDIYLTSTSNRMNEVMKVLTIIATIFIPMTFIAGVYGMNFRHMPELDVWWAYPVTLGVMGLVAGGMLIYFRRKGWI